MTLSIIVASSGRPTLTDTIESARSQMRDGDEILVSIQSDCPWGNAARNQLMRAARGDALMFVDDDDAYARGALDKARAAFEAEPTRMHLFRMRYPDNRILWQDARVVSGNVSTQMVVVPAGLGRRVQFGDRYEGDYDFIAGCQRYWGEPAWHEDIITYLRPHEAAA